MAQALETLIRNTKTLDSIRGIVHTMKTLSAINARPYEHAARSIEAYHATVLQGFRAFLHRNGPLPPIATEVSTQVIVVFGSDHGMCGSYNEIVATQVSGYLDTIDAEHITTHVLCVGAQLNDALNGQDIWPESTLLPPASAEGIGRLAGDIVTRMDDIRQKALSGEIAVTLIFTDQMSNGQQQPVTKILLPLDTTLFGELADRPWVSRSLPDFNMPSKDLLSALIRSHLFASIFRASAEALVTENAARLSQMQHAEQSVDDRLEELKSETRMVRQEEITNELMDVIIGFEALKKGRRKAREQ
ncbi:MAG: ATPase [Rhodobacteraceae bacterium]|nr:MAG: ATPase [Paracoccaceae bacterium]